MATLRFASLYIASPHRRIADAQRQPLACSLVPARP
jgi:hypothetical protein